MQEFIVYILPNKLQALKGVIMGSVGAFLSYLFGDITPQTQALTALIIIDYLTGVMAGYINPQMELDSTIGFKGILKKFCIFAVISACHFFDVALGQNWFCLGITWSFIGNEGLSILENAGNAGLPIPTKLKDTLRKIKEWEKATK